MILWFYRTPIVGQSQRFDFDFWLFYAKSEISILKISYLVYLYHFHSLNLIFTSLKPLLNLSLTKATLQLKSTLLCVDRPDTYTLLDFISLSLWVRFYKFCLTYVCVFNDRTKTLCQASSYLERIMLFYPTHMMNMVGLVAIDVETPRIDNGCSLEIEFTELIYTNPWMVLC